ncbi:MAG: AbrB/MazE/SpoVT family DNA-binding domain-containing protein [Candidatus Beckwithbacteria bacterium]|nr:AbrB/MazE/SpoVT family DNA-binding domain-containing protein [Patescibacteria group bacterium]
MQAITTVTQKGQITLPKLFREQVNINLFDKVVVKLGNGKLIIEPTEDILDIAGSFKPKFNKDKSALDAREAMENNYSRF